MNFFPDRNRRNALTVAVHKAIVATFADSDWRALGHQTGTWEWMWEHPRLLRSLHFGDDDYATHAFSAVEEILKADPDNLLVLFEFPCVNDWLRQNRPDLHAEAVAAADPLSVTSPTPRITSGVVESALRDAEHLIAARGPVNGLDRVHTALHGYLHAACVSAGITCSTDPGVTDLYKLLRQHHPALRATGPRAGEVEKVLKAFGAVLDALNTVRNRASLAHPNPTLLGEAEATRVINAARTVLHYLDARFAEAARTGKGGTAGFDDL